jgi:hypothetical protein
VVKGPAARGGFRVGLACDAAAQPAPAHARGIDSAMKKNPAAPFVSKSDTMGNYSSIHSRLT